MMRCTACGGVPSSQKNPWRVCHEQGPLHIQLLKCKKMSPKMSQSSKRSCLTSDNWNNIWLGALEATCRFMVCTHLREVQEGRQNFYLRRQSPTQGLLDFSGASASDRWAEAFCPQPRRPDSVAGGVIYS